MPIPREHSKAEIAHLLGCNPDDNQHWPHDLISHLQEVERNQGPEVLLRRVQALLERREG